ncbi:MAG TPA: YggT family protein [Myxococcales bacterium LLY-WYZ-16_1]|jgi:YggT family protein|nr:YggT family protein [Myxococcales bacterium LLY-WYZ-16_1]
MGPVEFFILAVQVATWVILIDAISSWVVGPDSFPRNLTAQLTEPLYRPIRSVLDPQKMGGLDLSPMVAIVALQLVAQAVARSVG